MTPDQKLSAKRWNERLRLVVTFLNVTSIGAFGLSVVTPILAFLNVRSQLIDSVESIDAYFAEVSQAWYEVIIWPVAVTALLLHVFAHILLSLLEPED